MTPTDSTQQVLGACPHDCPDTCSLITTVQNGIAIKVEGNPHHPQTAGVLCTKVSRYTERTYHPERILQPMKRAGPKGSGQFVPVSWDAALDDIALRLRSLQDQGKPLALLPYSYAGTMGKVQGEAMASRFFNRFGASELDRTICASAGGHALMHTLGAKVGMRVEFFAESSLILIWGSNAIGSNLHFWRYAQEAKRRGAKLICIDPRRTETADKCHAHIALLPGTDAALALGLMHLLIAHDHLDHDYIARYTLGWDALKARAMEWAPERVAAVCGIPVQQVLDLAHDYGQSFVNKKPAAIRLNYGMQRSRGAGNAVRAVLCLPALVGAWRFRAGGVLVSSSSTWTAHSAALERPDLRTSAQRQLINMSNIGDALSAYIPSQHSPPQHSPDQSPAGSSAPTASAPHTAIEALIVYNSNPVAVAPDSSRVVSGFAREDLFTVVLEHFQTDTADYADYLLPATTQLEHWDVHTTYGHTDALLNRPAIAPLGQAKTNSDIFRLLAKRLGFTDTCFDEDDESLCRLAFGSQLNFAQLLQVGFVSPPLEDAPFATGGFLTASNKCEFYSEALRQQGLDPVPNFLPNYEESSCDPRFPLAMISPPARNFMNSTFVNVQSLRNLEGEPLLEIHPTDAARRHISTGDVVNVFNSRGNYVCKAQVNTRARLGVVVGLGVWWRKLGLQGTNVNEITSQRLTDMGRAPTFYDCAVEVEKAP